jgi:hypothetical protein
MIDEKKRAECDARWSEMRLPEIESTRMREKSIA